MTEPAAPLLPDTPLILYPESDGKPMADNTKQLRWIVTLYGNLAALFRDDPNVFVGGNQFWYPVEGEPGVNVAPDVYAVFGRPKGDRPSYKQWEEGGIPMTVVVEVLSPENSYTEMADKYAFYEEHGAEEYYVYDPDENSLLIHVRKGEVLRRVRPVAGFVSPRLGIRFDTSGPELVVRYPDGRPFLTFEELEAERERESQQRQVAEQRADEAEHRAEQEHQQRLTAEQQREQERQQRLAAEQRAGVAEQQGVQERQQRLAAEQRAAEAERVAARLAELSRKARQQQASPEELAELVRWRGKSRPPLEPRSGG